MSQVLPLYQAVNFSPFASSATVGFTRPPLASAPSFTGVLDSVGISAQIAYGLRKLRTAYAGSAVRVRRSSDNAELDIGFTSGGDLDTVALLAHCGAGNGFVVTWYDQSGNGRDITQSTAVAQPQIVVLGAVLTRNSKPSMNFMLGMDFLNTTLTLTCFTINQVAAIADSLATYQVIRQQNTTSGNTWYTRYETGTSVFQGVGTLISGGTPGTALHVLTGQPSESSGSRIYLNGTSAVSGAIMTPAATVGNMRVGQSPVGGQSFSGDMSEIILFSATLTTAQRQTCERNQGTFYGITVA
jgi:hypothetical protein